MGDFKDLLAIAGQLGGMGTLAFVVLFLHREALRMFAEQSKESLNFWSGHLAAWMRAKGDMHRETCERLDRHESLLMEIKTKLDERECPCEHDS